VSFFRLVGGARSGNGSDGTIEGNGVVMPVATGLWWDIMMMAIRWITIERLGCMLTIIPSREEFNTTINDNSVVVLDCFAVWCGPCKVIAPQVDKYVFSSSFSPTPRPRLFFQLTLNKP
jgi:hypothetical protein